jgi:hypothetical protein
MKEMCDRKHDFRMKARGAKQAKTRLKTGKNRLTIVQTQAHTNHRCGFTRDKYLM